MIKTFHNDMNEYSLFIFFFNLSVKKGTVFLYYNNVSKQSKILKN